MEYSGKGITVIGNRLPFYGGIQRAWNSYSDTGDPHFMLTIFTGKMLTESRSLFDNDIENLFYGSTRIFFKTMKCTIALKDIISHTKGRNSYLDGDFDH